MLERPRPDAEFFHVVAERRDAVWMHGSRFAQIVNYVFDFSERNQIAQRLLSGKQAHSFAAILGLIYAE